MKTNKTMVKKITLAGFLSLCLNVFLYITLSDAASAPQATYLNGITDGMHSPARIAVGPNGDIYVTDPRKAKIHVYRPTGELMRSQAVGGAPLSVAVDNAGNVYVGDATAKTIKVYDTNWLYLRVIGAGNGESDDISISSSTGKLFATDGKNNVIRIYNSDGTLYKTVGGMGSATGKFNFPTGVTVNDAAGDVIVVDQMNNRIQIFDLDGNYKSAITPPASTRSGSYSNGALASGQGLAVDGQRRIYAVDAFLGTVHVYDGNGAWLKSIGSFGTGPGRLNVPLDVVIDGYNRLLITSSNTSAVEIYGIDAYTVPTTDPSAQNQTPSSYALSGVQWESGTIDLASADLFVGVIITDTEILDIDVASVRLNAAVPVEAFTIKGDLLTLRFNKDKVRATLTVSADGDATVAITGNMRAGGFSYAGTVKVIR